MKRSEIGNWLHDAYNISEKLYKKFEGKNRKKVKNCPQIILGCNYTQFIQLKGMKYIKRRVI